MKARALSFEKKRYLVHVYLTQGYTAAKPIAIQYGIKPKTISKYTKAMGINRPRGREPGVWKGETKTQHDPRWQVAIQRGSVIA